MSADEGRPPRSMLNGITMYAADASDATKREWWRQFQQTLASIGVGPGDDFFIAHPDLLNVSSPFVLVR